MKNMVILSLVIVVSGCAMSEPPRVENGRYINFEYRFSLRVPEGWEYSETIPQPYAKGLTTADEGLFKAAFSEDSYTQYDINYTRYIIVEAAKTELALSYLQADFISDLNGELIKKEKIFRNQFTIGEYFNYEIYEDQILNCRDACVILEVSYQIKSNRCLSRHIIYKTNSGRYNYVVVLLIAREDKFVDSVDIFYSVVDSFQRYYR